MSLYNLILKYDIHVKSIFYIGDITKEEPENHHKIKDFINSEITNNYNILYSNKLIDLTEDVVKKCELVMIKSSDDEFLINKNNDILIKNGFNILQKDNEYLIYIKYNNTKKMCVYLMGGIGNQIYQLVALYKYSKIHGYKPIFDRKYVKLLHSGDIIFDLYPELHQYIPDDKLDDNYVKYNETENLYQDIPALGSYQMIEGYFQGEFYFDKEDARNMFRNFVKLPSDVIPPDITIHIRRGNALTAQHIYHVPGIDYYTNSMKHMPEGSVAVITEDLKWAKESLGEILKGRKVEWINGDLINDFKLLANATKGTIMANSTYSWWAALLNPNNPIVIYPQVWFHPSFPNYKKDQYHSEGWISVLDGPDTYQDFISELVRHRDNKEWDTILMKLEKLNIKKNLHISNSILNKLLDEYYMALFYKQKITECVSMLNYYKYSCVNDHIINNTDYLLNYLRRNKKVIATTNVNRKPSDTEIVIIYGDFPYMYENLVACNPCYRHFKYFSKLHHDEIEYDKYWDHLDKIYVINMNNREDRYIQTVSELLKLRIPLNKIERFPAIVAKDWGCSASHLEVIKNAISNNYQNVLIFEDDFCVTSLVDKCRDDIKKFLERKYDYDVCLLATNTEFCKNSDYDDLLYKINARVTTCAGYFISLNCMKKLEPIWTEALIKFKSNPSNHNYACDVSWEPLQKDNKFFQFITKIGYQRPFLYENRTVFCMF